MKYRSVRNQSPPVSFREALFSGLAPDGGLYVPESIPRLPPTFLEGIAGAPLHAIGDEVLSPFIDDIPREELRSLIAKALNFPIPLVKLEDGVYLLELFHGPTLAFKDVGARFMAQASSYFLAQESRTLTILVATSGDTGSAVAHGFHNVPHISVYILYPSGQISRLQEQQMTTLGGNIHAIEVKGTFDDCQRLVKDTLVDREILAARPVTTANSMNVARLLPQIIYYFWGISRLAAETGGTNPLVVVPSGNFGNLTAAVYAKWMGVPIRGFVAATNANDVVPEYLHTGTFTPRPSVRTLSNAMDVGNPSNLARLQALYRNDVGRMKNDIDAVSISDEETLAQIKSTFGKTGRVIDPHTAVGVAAAMKRREGGPGSPPVIVASTAHPAKFPETIERAIKRSIAIPAELEEAMGRQKQSTVIRPDYPEWKRVLMGG